MNFAVVDFETTSLKSDQGFLLCGAFYPLGGTPYVIGLREYALNEGAIKPEDKFKVDRRLALRLRDEIERYDGWITWNGIMYDIPYLDDRCLLSGRDGEDRDPHEKRWHIDIMYQARQGKSCMTSSRLKWVEDQLGLEHRKTDLELSIWKMAEAEALLGTYGDNYLYVVEHALMDVEVEREAYELLKNRVQSMCKR